MLLFVLVASCSYRINMWVVRADTPQNDEGHLYEQAVATLVGDYDHDHPDYGPLHMYGLSAVFWGYTKVTGQTIFEFGKKTFFNYTEHLAITRIYCFLLYLLMVGVMCIWGQRIFGKKGAYLGAALCLLLAADQLVNRQAKVDSMLPLWHVLTCFALIRISQFGRLKHHILAGLFIGLAGAVKPLIGFAILPAAFIAKGVFSYRRSKEDSSSFFFNFFDFKLLAAVFASIAAFFTTYPYALINFPRFWHGLFNTISRETKIDAPLGYQLINYIPHFGLPLMILTFCSLLFWAFKGGVKERILLVFPVTFFAGIAFLPVTGNFHYYIFPMLMLALGVFVAERATLYKTPFVAPCIVVATVWLCGGFDFLYRNPFEPFKLSPQLAEEYIHMTIPPGAKICILGPYQTSARLMDKNPEHMKPLGSYLKRNRKKHKPYLDLFYKGHADAIAASQKPNYTLYGVNGFSEYAAEARDCIEKGYLYFVSRRSSLKEFKPFVEEMKGFGYLVVGKFKKIRM